MGNRAPEQLRYHHRAPTPARAPRVIVAEDDPDVRLMVAVALRGMGYEITEASSGAELLDQLADGLLDHDPGARPDVIISDVRMPGLTGLEILAGLRQASWPTVFVLMTAYADRRTRDEARSFGVDALFEKPFDIDDLVTAVINMAPAPLPPRGKRLY
jgi:CheY-like chemotaxis protein